jgi:DNA primase
MEQKGQRSRGRITREAIQGLLARVSLLDLVGHRVQLRPSGGRHVGLCPFHSEKSPSFFVYDDHYKCYGCGVHGNAIDFEMATSGAPFVDTVESLAARFGYELSYEGAGSAADEASLHRRHLSDILKEVAQFYERCLHHPRHGAAARAYLQQVRGFSDETLQRFGLGVALAQSSLQELARKKGWDRSALIELGLIRESARNAGHHYDFFRNRVMVPITNERGVHVGFGARVLPEQEKSKSGGAGPKYLNSSESGLFSKSSLLFHVHGARPAMGRSREVIVVEGYMDAIALVQAGITGVVAVLGTALTGEHVRILARHVDRVCLCFDADGAGQQAMIRSFQTAWPLNLVQLYAFSVRGAKDPDELVRQQGVDAFLEQKEQALPLVRAVAAAVTAGCAYREERVRRVRQAVIPYVVQSPGVAERQAALSDLAEFLHLPSPAGLTPLGRVGGGAARKGAVGAKLSEEKSEQAGASRGPALVATQSSVSEQGNLRSGSANGRVGAGAADPVPQVFMRSAAELKFCVHLWFADRKDVPERIWGAGGLACSAHAIDVAICARALKAVMAVDGLSFVDRVLCGLCGGAWEPLVASGPAAGAEFLVAFLRAYVADDSATVQKIGVPLVILGSGGMGVSSRFDAEKSIFDLDNIPVFRFLLRDAREAQVQGATPSHLSRLLLDLEIAYLDNELAQWTADEQGAPLIGSTEKSGDYERYRRIMQERARRLLCLRQDSPGLGDLGHHDG